MKLTNLIHDFNFYYMGTLWSVEITSDKEKLGIEDEPQAGVCDYSTCSIFVDSNQSNNEIVKTLLHEIHHVILAPIRNEKLKEEAVVELLAQGRWEIDPQLPKYVHLIMKEYRNNMIYSLTSGINKKGK